MMKNLLVAFVAVVAFFCGSTDAYGLDKVGDVYQIANADDLIEFSDLVAVLTDDIDLSGYEWFPIGTPSSTYSGTFDGQEHRIYNMEVNTEDEYQGLFGVISNGAHIMNIIIDSSCIIHGARFVGGIAGGSNGGGSITIENCGNEGEVTATEQNAAGIIGVSMMSQCTFIIRNCYNVGFVGGVRESAAISGWCGDNGSVVENCWNMGTLDGQEHEIKVDYNCVHDTIALFRCIEDALIERLVVSGEVKTSRKFAAGLFAAGWGTNVIRNCIIKTNIISNFEGDYWENTETSESGYDYDATHGGLCCFAHGTCTITNCAVLGDLIAELSEGSAGIMGYPNGGSNVKITNCLVAGNFALSNNNALITRPNGAVVENCYYVDNGFAFDSNEAEEITSDIFATGELAYLLNGRVSGGTNWYQTIDTDEMPVPFASHKIVYLIGTLRCDGTPDAAVEGIFSVNGARQNTLQRGVNIVKMSNGSVRKVIVK